jgi:hypothetical protein
MDLPLAVADGINTPPKLAERYGFDKRQSLYYLQAAEMLGFVLPRKERYQLSALGRRYVALTQPQRKELLSRKMLSMPVMLQVMVNLALSPIHRMTKDQLARLVSSRAGISATTASRRVQSICNWLAWLEGETGMFRVSKDHVSIPVSSKG